MALLLAAALPSAAALRPTPGAPTALVELQRRDPAAAAALDRVQRSIMAQLTWIQLEALRAGLDPRELELADGSTLRDHLVGALGLNGYAIPFFTIDGGGGVSTGGDFRVVGTLAQPEAGDHLGGTFSLLGGYWPLAVKPPLLIDGFETGDTSRWSAVTP